MKKKYYFYFFCVKIKEFILRSNMDNVLIQVTEDCHNCECCGSYADRIGSLSINDKDVLNLFSDDHFPSKGNWDGDDVILFIKAINELGYKLVGLNKNDDFEYYSSRLQTNAPFSSEEVHLKDVVKKIELFFFFKKINKDDDYNFCNKVNVNIADEINFELDFEKTIIQYNYCQYSLLMSEILKKISNFKYEYKYINNYVEEDSEFD